MLKYVYIYKNRQGSKYMACNKVNECFLRDRTIQNPVKDL